SRARDRSRRDARRVPARRRGFEPDAHARRRAASERRRPEGHLRKCLAHPRTAASRIGSVEKPWLASYPAGVPAAIDPDRYASLAALLEQSFARFGKAPAFTNLGVTLTFADVDRLSRALAAYLQALPGMQRGDRVAIMLPNLLQSPVAIFGVLRAGMAVVNVNPLYTVRELEHQLADSGARVVVVLENFAHTLEQALPKT